MGRSRKHAELLSKSLFAPKVAFRSEYLDFERGIRVGHLEPGERITRILKAALEERHGVRMITDRWGRGVYWQWICWVPEPNRKAKPLSAAHNFASAKFFIAIDRDDRIFQCGMQVERAPTHPAKGDWPTRLAKDWDWNVFLHALEGAELPSVVRGLLREGFRARVGPFSELEELDRRSWSVAACLRHAGAAAAKEWGGFQLFWPMPQAEVKATPGPEIVDAILAVFDEVTPAMDLCMLVRLA
jgi:hypothetical protein